MASLSKPLPRFVFTRPRWKRLIPPAIAGALVAAGVLAWDSGDWRLNLSPSEPIGIWSVHPVQQREALHVGQTVTLCPPLPGGYDYRWLWARRQPNLCASGIAPFLKTIVAGPGDTVTETAQGVRINGKPLPDSRPLPFTTGTPSLSLPQWRGTIHLKKDQYWAYGAGDPAYSFDSRYWGPFTRQDVRGVAHSVLSFKVHWVPKHRT